jgi:hypothetical protein
MGLGFVAAGAAKDLVAAVGVGGCWGLGCCHGCGGCWGNWLLWVDVGGVWEKKNSFFNNILIECSVK